MRRRSSGKLEVAGGGGARWGFSRAYRLPLPSQVPDAELQYY